MISETAVNQQLVRLAVLRGAPETTDEVVYAFREAAKNQAHASRITDWLLRHQTFFPTPSEIYNASSQTLREDDMPRPDRKCKACGGTGYAQAWELVTYEQTSGGGSRKTVDVITDAETAAALRLKVDGRTQVVYDGVVRCRACSYGRAIAEAKAREPEAEKSPAKVDERELADVFGGKR